MKAGSLLMVLFLCAYACPAQRSAAEKKAAAAYEKAENEDVAYVKAIDVNTLDPSLPSQRFEEWLQFGPPHIDHLRWMLDDTCDLKPDLDADYPRCVRIDFERGGQSGWILILIGTLKKGIIGPPQLYEPIDVFERPFINTGGTDRLSGLPSLLDQPVVAGEVNDLYQEIVDRHPIGIPTGEDKAALWPFLSQRLTQQLETAQACQDDYFRQRQAAGSISKPSWMTSDLFSGEDERGAPFFVNIVHKEPLKDGVFAVQLDAVERDITGKNSSIIAGGIRAYRVKRDWPIIANVVLENKRFVVDDIRIFEEDTTDGPSHLLSETFAGCDGSHWTGAGVDNKPPPALPGPHYTDWDAVNALRSAAFEEEVAFAKEADVHELDPALPSERLEDWLKSSPLHLTHIEWRGLQCNLHEGRYDSEGRYSPARDPDGRMCAEVWFQSGNARANIQIVSNGKSASGPPKVKYIVVRDKDDGLLTPVPADGNMEKVSDSDRLSDLPQLLDEEAVIDVTRNLYDAVVAGHPLGIPVGQDRVTIGPLLSKNLREQLENGRACQADYLRQHPGPAKVTKPAWFNAGLFSGEGELALPGAELVDHKERQKDGSFLVLVWLSRENSTASDSATPVSRWRTWHVSALVKSENGRFVVDDVRLFGDDSLDGPSRLLSDQFGGCEGPRWVGVGSR